MLEPAVARLLAEGEQHIVLAGAGGWLGLATLDLLEKALGDRLDARVSCYGSAARTLTLQSGRQVVQAPLTELPKLQAQRIWLFHFAFLTKDRAETLSEEAYRAANDAISATVLTAARALPVEALFVASSGAVTKIDDPQASPAMRLYGEMKLADERRFAAWAEESGRRAVIGRIFNITGPYINKHAAYAIANFILDALAQRPIAVRAPREVFRAYVAIRELVSLILAMMAAEASGVVHFDTGGTVLELGAVAAAVAEALGGAGVERAAVTEAVADRYAGDGAAYAALLAHYGITPVPLDVQIHETAGFLRGRHS
ncbi:NAD-dependent epimerase/dehydratase family protein [Sphingomonas trueperi]|uniref:Nucleoside-diphosphate-sugar epimerase n=1 Tax=Sphingomonas trueperi TaxID=53317 RepID=A0A7X5XWN9_9SPHN|nr:NAD-dependent epimerase/dehydratase family protein [Sphingomonas trueperi]NJB96328.1 nucleoside-diphosphate-sugar epimerase [Sphingomonas trueperi]